jgi:cellulose synthase/poly-beta-1,6-N-acetylglucosamine synthase-like glycosyltransferase
MILAASILLILSLASLAYAYVGYPLLLSLRARRGTLLVRSADIEPAVTIIIPVYNRASIIEQKLQNTLALDYPAELMEILVVCDGCSDGSEAVVERVARTDGRVRLIAIPRSGKLVALQHGGRRARGEILVFSDANVSLDAGAVRQLVRPFAERFVGGVCAASRSRRSRGGDSTGVGDRAFARYEDRIRRMESRIGSVHAADAALYAIRRSLFVPARNLAQADDIAISARVVLAGYRLVYEPRAVCRKATAADGAREFRRRTQIVNYTIRSILDMKWELLRNRSYGFLMFSHVIARYMVPVTLIGLLVASAMLTMVHIAFAGLLVAQLGWHSLALAGWLLRRTRIGRLPFLALPCYFGMMHLAALAGVSAVLRGYRPHGAMTRVALQGGRAERPESVSV